MSAKVYESACELLAKVVLDPYLRLEKLETDKKNSSAYGFLMLMKRLRRIILQDAALMHQKYPTHFIFKHRLFETDLWKTYSLQVIAADSTIETPMDIQLQQVMPGHGRTC